MYVASPAPSADPRAEKWPVSGANREWSGADFQVKLPSGQWFMAPLATTYAEAEAHAKLAWPTICAHLDGSDDGTLPRLAVKWLPRGLGVNSGIPDLVTGDVHDGVRPDLSGFVATKADGELAVALFGGRAVLDFRPHEPDWIQVKVSADAPILEKLVEFVNRAGGDLTSDRVQQAIWAGTPASNEERLRRERDEAREALLKVAEEIGLTSATNLLHLDVRAALNARAARFSPGA